MAIKAETRFRKNTVKPFLKTLKHVKDFPIQQLAIVGDPDFLLCLRGHFVALELKDEFGTLSEIQRHKLKEVARAGGFALVASPQNWESIKAQLQAIDRGDYDGNKKEVQRDYEF